MKRSGFDAHYPNGMWTMSDLNGVWRLTNDAFDDTIVFGHDTLLLGREKYAWAEKHDCLFILPADAQIVVPYRCEETLCISTSTAWSRCGSAW